MCGLGGLISKNGTADRNVLQSMADYMVERGPDNFDIIQNENFGFVHRRLSIIDLSEQSNQPLESEDWIMVYNGEIYNYLEVINSHKDQFPEKCKKSDTLFLFELFHKFSIQEALKMIKGMFAIGLFNKSQKILYLIRDQLGKKPLYYASFDEQFIFCSDIRPISNSLLNKSIDLVSLEHYLYDGAVPQPRSIYNEIKQVDSGSILEFRFDEFNYNIINYYSFESPEKIISEVDFVYKETEERLHKAVSRRMNSDVPFGAFLSGGIDSTLVTHLMSKNSDKKISTYTIGFEGDKNNELEVASRISRILNTDHHELNVNFNPSELVEELIGYMGEPMADASILPTFLICREIKSDVTVALSGDGGDEVFYGYPPFLVGFKSQMVKLNRLKYYASKVLVKTKFSSSNYPYLCDFKSMSNQEKINRFIGFNKFDRKTLLNNKNSDSDFDKLFHINNSTSYTIPQLLSRLYLNGRLKNSYLVKLDRMSMKNSLEVRSPLLDIDVIEFMSKVDDNLKLNYGKTLKAIPKKMISEIIPESILNLPKKGFGVPLNELIRNDLKEVVEQAFKNYSGVLINKNFILQLLEKHLENKVEKGQQIWNLFVLIKWAQINNEEL